MAATELLLTLLSLLLVIVVFKKSPLQKSFKILYNLFTLLFLKLSVSSWTPINNHINRKCVSIPHAPDHASLSLPFSFLHLWKKFLINIQLSVNGTFQKKPSPILPPELIILNYQCTLPLLLVNNFFFLFFSFTIHSFIHPPKG